MGNKLFFLFVAIFFLLYAGNTKVETINKEELKKIIENRNGKILVLNIWATWCIPCREEFPDLIKVQRENNNVEIVGISTDYPDEIDSKILPFLKKMKPVYKNYVSEFSSDTELINFLNPDWNGALPATFIYDNTGAQKLYLSGKKNYDQFAKAIRKILKEKP